MTSLDSSRLTESFDLLAHPYRRFVVYHLRTESGAVGIDTLATEIAKLDLHPAGADGSDESDVVEIRLRHVHLPKLADGGLISFDASTDSIGLEDADGLDQLLDVSARVDGYVQTAVGD